MNGEKTSALRHFLNKKVKIYYHRKEIAKGTLIHIEDSNPKNHKPQILILKNGNKHIIIREWTEIREI